MPGVEGGSDMVCTCPQCWGVLAESAVVATVGGFRPGFRPGFRARFRAIGRVRTRSRGSETVGRLPRKVDNSFDIGDHPGYGVTDGS